MNNPEQHLFYKDLIKGYDKLIDDYKKDCNHYFDGWIHESRRHSTVSYLLGISMFLNAVLICMLMFN